MQRHLARPTLRDPQEADELRHEGQKTLPPLPQRDADGRVELRGLAGADLAGVGEPLAPGDIEDLPLVAACFDTNKAHVTESKIIGDARRCRLSAAYRRSPCR